MQRVNNGVLPLVMGVLLHDRSCRFVRAEEWRRDCERKDDGGRDDTGERCRRLRVVSGCFQQYSLIFLRMETNFCHACKCLRVYSMYRRTIDALYFRYGTRRTGKRKRGGKKKRKAHTTFHLHFLLLADL